MFHMRPKRRGLQLQSMGFGVDQMLNPQSEFSLMVEETTANGWMRGIGNASADWIRDGTCRVELKSSSLRFHRRENQWFCQFTSIKPDLFDELWLAVYSPCGVHFYRAKALDRLPLATNGIATQHSGLELQVRGPKNEGDPLEALRRIGEKMVLRGCELLATVQWQSGLLAIKRLSSTWTEDRMMLRKGA